MKKLKSRKPPRPSAQSVIEAVAQYVDIESLPWCGDGFDVKRDLKPFGYSEKKYRNPAERIEELRKKAKEALDAYRT
jgi:hypothetical protein